MKWTAIITSKSPVDVNDKITYSFDIVGGGEAKMSNVTVTDSPNTIQDLVALRVKSFAGAFELAQDLPGVGEELEIIS